MAAKRIPALALALLLAAAGAARAESARELNGFGDVRFGMTRAEVTARLDGRVRRDGNGLRRTEPVQLSGPPLEVLYDFDGADRLGRVRLQAVESVDFLDCLGNFQRFLQLLTARHGRADYVLTDSEAGLHAWRGIFVFNNGAGVHLNTDYRAPELCETGIFFLAPESDQREAGN